MAPDLAGTLGGTPGIPRHAPMLPVTCVRSVAATVPLFGNLRANGTLARILRFARWEPRLLTDIQEVLFTPEQIAERVSQMGEAITRDYAPRVEAGEGVVMMCVLRGAAIFMADLARAVHLPLEMDYMAVSSYGAAAKSSGIVRITKDLSGSIQGKHLIIAEDIIDSGLTLNYLRKNLASRNPLSIEVAAMLRKDIPREQDVECRYLGFECPDAFVVGYGLDFAERYRNLSSIGVLKPEIYE